MLGNPHFPQKYDNTQSDLEANSWCDELGHHTYDTQTNCQPATETLDQLITSLITGKILHFSLGPSFTVLQ